MPAVAGPKILLVQVGTLSSSHPLFGVSVFFLSFFLSSLDCASAEPVSLVASLYHETHCAASKHRARVRPWKRCAPAYSNAGALVAALRLVAALVKAAAKVFVWEQSSEGS